MCKVITTLKHKSNDAKSWKYDMTNNAPSETTRPGEELIRCSLRQTWMWTAIRIQEKLYVALINCYERHIQYDRCYHVGCYEDIIRIYLQWFHFSLIEKGLARVRTVKWHKSVWRHNVMLCGRRPSLRPTSVAACNYSAVWAMPPTHTLLYIVSISIQWMCQILKDLGNLLILIYATCEPYFGLKLKQRQRCKLYSRDSALQITSETKDIPRIFRSLT